VESKEPANEKPKVGKGFFWLIIFALWGVIIFLLWQFPEVFKSDILNH